MPSKSPPESPPEDLTELQKRLVRAERGGADVAEARQILLQALLLFRERRLEEMAACLGRAAQAVDQAERARREEGLRRRLWDLKESGADALRLASAETALGKGALEEAEAVLGDAAKAPGPSPSGRKPRLPQGRGSWPLFGASEAALAFESGCYQILLGSPRPGGGMKVLEVRRGEAETGALEKAMVEALRSLRPRPQRVHLAIPSDDHVLATVPLPSLPAKEQPQALRWKLAKLCGFPGEESLVAFRPAASATPGSFLGLLARRAAIRKAVGMVERTGLPAGRVLAPGQSLACLLPEGAGREARALLQIGRGSARLYVFAGGEMTFSRDLGVGARTWLEDLGTPISSTRGTVRLSDSQAREVLARFDVSASENLVLQDGTSLNDKDLMSLLRASLERLQDALSRSLAFAAGQEGATPVGRVFLCGEGASLPGLDRILSAHAGIPVSILPLPQEGGESLLPVDALAASLFAVSGKEGLLDLLPPAARTRTLLAREGRGVLAAGLLVASLLGGIAFLQAGKRPALQEQQARLKDSLQKMDGTVEDINRELKARRAPPRAAGDPPAFIILRALGEVLPPEASVQGISLDLAKGERPSLLLEVTRGHEEGFAEALSRSPLLGSASSESGDQGVTRYRFAVAMEPLP